MTEQLSDYHQWIASLKARLRSVQIKAAIAVQTELLQFYWDLGSDIVERQKSSTWGDGFLKQLSQDLMAEFPDMKGFSRRNLELVRQWYVFWTSFEPITKQLVSQLCSIPWGHNLAIISKAKTPDEALYYLKNTLEYGWSRNVLVHQIESGLYQREGKAITNFSTTLPVPQSDLAQQVLKDPYVFDFLALTKEHTERELENGLVQHVTKFLLELGSGFAYMGRQVPVFVGEREFFLDLLFYHARLHCYLVIELKVGDFEPAHAGQLNFYVKAVDEQLRKEVDQPTIGLLLCKNKDRLVAEYALSDIAKPLGISEYQLTRSLPESFKSSLPSIEDIEAEIGMLSFERES